MADRLNVVPDELRQAAEQHRHTADYLASVPSNHPEIMASLESLGPIFAEFREAGHELLDQRRLCYQDQAAAHTDLAERLLEAAARWQEHDADAARRLRDVAEGGR
jgi:hypothetical protein